MTPEHYEHFNKAYPELFGDNFRPSAMSINDGWFDIIDVLCRLIVSDYTHQKATAEKNGTVPAKLLKIQQVKEKFGSLRFYCYGASDNAHAYNSTSLASLAFGSIWTKPR